MPKLLFDANISYRIKKKVNTYFDDVLHVTDTNLEVPAKDIDIWDWAKINNYLIVSYDGDFERLFNINGFPPKLILLKIGNQSNQFIADILITSFEEIVSFEKNPTQGLLEIIPKLKHNQ